MASETAKAIVGAVLEGRIKDAEALWSRTVGRPAGQSELPVSRSPAEPGWDRLARGLLLFELGDPSSAAEHLEAGLGLVEVPEPVRVLLLGRYARALVRCNDVFGGLRALRSEISPASVREPSLALAIALAGIFDDVNAPESSVQILRWAVSNGSGGGPPAGWHELTLGTAHLVGSYELFMAGPAVSAGEFTSAAALLDRAVVRTRREEATSAMVRAELARGSGATREAADGFREAAAMAKRCHMAELHQLASLRSASLLPPEQAAPLFGEVVGDRCFGLARRRYHEVGRTLADTIGDAQTAYLHQRALFELELGYRQFTLALSGGLGLFTSEAMISYQQARVENRLARTESAVANRREEVIGLTNRISQAIDGLDLKLRDLSSLSAAAIDGSVREVASLLDLDENQH